VLARTANAVAERERLVRALPAQYAHVDNPERFHQLAEQAFAGDEERHERALAEFARLRDEEPGTYDADEGDPWPGPEDWPPTEHQEPPTD
jgi:hypothetical protein